MQRIQLTFIVSSSTQYGPAAPLLGLCVRIPPETWMSVFVTVVCRQIEASESG